jgi:hypothetical protein
VGFVGEVWLGPGDEPKAFAVRTTEGRHGLLLADDVLALSPEDETVVLRPGARLLELQPPRLGSDTQGPDSDHRVLGDERRHALAPARRDFGDRSPARGQADVGRAEPRDGETDLGDDRRPLPFACPDRRGGDRAGVPDRLAHRRAGLLSSTLEPEPRAVI